jgi:CheY-like chemotaxis protein
MVLVSPARLVVAEDDPDMRDLVVATLRADGYDVVEATNGAELLARVAEGDCAIVLTDVRMPQVSGIEALERMRGDGHSFPVVIMSAFADAALTARVRRLGAVVIAKPFDIGDLRELIAALLPSP